MAFSVRAYAGSAWHSLSGWGPFQWLDDEGLGMAPSHEISERGPQQHGESRISYRLDPRRLMAVIGFEAASLSAYWTHRNTLVGTIFAPADDPVLLEFTLDNGSIRQLDVFYAGDLALGYKDRAYLFQRAGIALKAPDPTFYDPTLQVVNFGVGALVAGWSIPWPIPWAISGSTIDQTTTVAYPGTWNSLPIVRIFGPITSPVISTSITLVKDGTTLTDTLDFTGTTIAAGDYYEVDLRYGLKTVIDAAGVNRIDTLTDDSDLATFAIRRAREAVGGTNTIRVQGSNVTGVTALQVMYYNRYLGI